MFKDQFDELWDKTVNSVLYAITAKEIKGTPQINDYIHKMVWNHAWGNKELVPPERKLLDDLSKKSPEMVRQIDSVLSDIKVSTSWGLYAGIAITLAGIIVLFLTQGVWQIAAGAAGVIGIVIAVIAAMQSRINPKKAASAALAKAKAKCDKILQ